MSASTHPSRGRTEPSTDDKAEVEEPMAEDRIGERRGNRQEDEQQHGPRRGRKDVRPRDRANS